MARRNLKKLAKQLAATATTDGSGPARVPGFTASNVDITYTFIANALDPTTHLRPYHAAARECGGATDQIRIIHVTTKNFAYAPVGFWAFLGIGPHNITVAHSERCIGPG